MGPRRERWGAVGKEIRVVGKGTGVVGTLAVARERGAHAQCK